jgi:WD40 repeat protein
VICGSGESHTLILNARTGMVFILDSSTFETVREERKSKSFIMDVQLSIDESKIAVSTGEGTILLCDTLTLSTLKVIDFQYCRAASLIDFSKDDRYLRIEYELDRLAYFDVLKSVPVANPNEVRDVKWSNPSFKYSFETQGSNH